MVTAKTSFYFEEMCLWHSAGLHAGTLPVGGWVQPSSGAGHAESPDSKRRLRSLMDVSGLSQHLAIQSAPPATITDVLRIHPQAYLDQLKKVSDAGGGMLGDNAPFGSGSYEIVLQSAGLAVQALDDVMSGRYQNAYALTRPPGHHCLPSQAMGFCFLANIAIAIEAMRVKHDNKKVAIIDWDVHHGNGTQAIYYDDPNTLTISLHQENCFPAGYSGENDQGHGAGLGTNLNIPLLAGSGDDAYLYAFERIIEPALARFKPDVIMVSCGFDANALDPLARMQCHSESFRKMTEHTMRLAQLHCQNKLVMLHEGGYSESYVPFCGHATLEALCAWRSAVEDPLLEFITLQQPSQHFIDFQRKLIDDMAILFDLTD